jgi:rRNA maturation endonuclease Nob1
LTEVGIESEAQVAEREMGLRASITTVKAQIEALRAGHREEQTTHTIDELTKTARSLGSDIAKLDLEAEELSVMRDRHARHRNEIDMLGLKFRRSAEAREILGDVAFSNCPRCTQALPTRSAQCCDVCGQEDLIDFADPGEVAALDSDIASRRAELTDAIATIDRNLAKIRTKRSALVQTKDKAEADINRAIAEQDSAFLSMSLLKERERAALEAELASIAWLLRLPLLLQQQREALAKIVALEQAKREVLKEARNKAEADRTSLDRFASYFLDSLTLSGVPCIQRDDNVELNPPDFYPAILSADPSDLTRSTFTSLSSGGKKTLFKCCFAIALHRIAAQLNAPLPALLIIDSPMKNISERENKAQFEGFYRMLYQLNAGELRHTQFVLIDKEFLAPPDDFAPDVTNRRMQPDSDEHPPLIRYYRGK